MKTGTDPIRSAASIFKQYRTLAEDAMLQLDDAAFFYTPDESTNSIALIVKHMAGNMHSRWTDFLTSDGEKSWRNRDREFELTNDNRALLMDHWNTGWAILFSALEPLNTSNMQQQVTIRGEAYSAMEAVNRQIAHYAYHVGQIVFLAKMIRGNQWKSLSIPKGQSQAFNDKMFTK